MSENIQQNVNDDQELLNGAYYQGSSSVDIWADSAEHYSTIATPSSPPDARTSPSDVLGPPRYPTSFRNRRQLMSNKDLIHEGVLSNDVTAPKPEYGAYTGRFGNEEHPVFFANGPDDGSYTGFSPIPSQVTSEFAAQTPAHILPQDITEPPISTYRQEFYAELYVPREQLRPGQSTNAAYTPNFTIDSFSEVHHVNKVPVGSGVEAPIPRGSPAMEDPESQAETADSNQMKQDQISAKEPHPAENDVSEFKGQRVAPRSVGLYRVGPPFVPTRQNHTLFCVSTNEQVVPEMTSRIDRGFEKSDAGNWIGYKRNYITLVSTFAFKGWNLSRFLKNKFYVVVDDDDDVDDDDANRRIDVQYFALSIAVKCSDPDVNVGLVQHTPKRDKGPKYPTPIYPALPGGELPDHQTVKASCNKRNGPKMATVKKIFNFDRQKHYVTTNTEPSRDKSILRNYPTDLPVKVARFERIQFTASLRAMTRQADKKYFTLSVQLLGMLAEPGSEGLTSVVLATSESCPLLVRGRSPSQYHAEKTSGYRAADYKSDVSGSDKSPDQQVSP